MGEQRHEWGDWLREQFDRHPEIRIPADLARAAGKKENGRPLIDPSRITQWLRGQRPSYDLTVAAAQAFGAPVQTALEAAGYANVFLGGEVITIYEDGTRDTTQTAVVRPQSDDAPAFRYQRPEGLSDQEWDELRRQHADYWDWLVERASRER